MKSADNYCSNCADSLTHRSEQHRLDNTVCGNYNYSRREVMYDLAINVIGDDSENVK